MEFKAPKSKNLGIILEETHLPSSESPVTGIFNGFHVIINDPKSIHDIYKNGTFGKGNLSKSQPFYNLKKDDIPKIIWNNQFEIESNYASQANFSEKIEQTEWIHNIQLANKSINNFFDFALANHTSNSLDSWKAIKRKLPCNNSKRGSIELLKFNTSSSASENTTIDEEFSNVVNGMLETKQAKKMKFSNSSFNNKIIVVDCNLENDVDNVLLNNISAKLENRPFPILENLILNLEESFFLCFALGCLKIFDLNKKELSLNEIWIKFCSIDKNFFKRYIIYHYYRTKGWIVQSGLKYGGDYLLYKDGPSHNHASYVVKILNEDKTFSWNEFLAINRLVETFNKDILFCKVIFKSSVSNTKTLLEQLANSCVLEIMSRRGLSLKDEISKTPELSME